MRKTSKVLSLALAGLMTVSASVATAFTAFAAEPADTNVYFEVPTEIWADAVEKTPVNKLKVYAHSYSVNNSDPEYKEKTWQTKGEQCKYVSDNIFSYDIDAKMKTSLKDGTDYVIIFSIVGDKSYQTCNVTMGKPCYGDTIVVTGETYENSVDSQKKDYKSVWKNEANAAVYGPKLEITSTGRVVGEKIPTCITPEEMVADFIHSYGVTNASLLSPESVQATCDNELLQADYQAVYDLYVEKYDAEFVAPVPASNIYVVAGTENFCGVDWKGSPEDAPANVMKDNGNGTYTKEFKDVQPTEAVQLKVVENTEDGTQNWLGDETGNNITFNVTKKCDVTVTFTAYYPNTASPEAVAEYLGVSAEPKDPTDDSAKRKITVTGDGVEFVTDLEITSINAVGNGDPEDEGGWLNGVAWDPSANEMTQVSDKVYEITFTNVTAYDNYQVKFAANGAWTDSWGSKEENFIAESGVEFDATYNGENITINVPYEIADVTLRLDLTNFDYATKTGAVATVTVKDMTPTYPVYIVGDVNNDKVIDANDVTALQMYVAKYTFDYEVMEGVADVDGNGKVNVLDVTALQKYLAGGYTNVGNAGKDLADVLNGKDAA